MTRRSPVTLGVASLSLHSTESRFSPVTTTPADTIWRRLGRRTVMRDMSTAVPSLLASLWSVGQFRVLVMVRNTISIILQQILSLVLSLHHQKSTTRLGYAPHPRTAV